MNKVYLTLIIGLLVLFSVNNAEASVAAIFGTKPAEAEPAAGEESVITDEYARDTPRGLVGGFINAVAERNYSEASKYLNLNSIPKSQREKKGPEIAEQLHKLLDQNGWVKPVNMVSELAEGDLEDNQPEEIERIGGIRTSEEHVPVLAERVIPKNTQIAPYWVISAETISKIPDLAKTAKTGLLNKYLPERLIRNEMFGVPIGHWLAMFAVAFAAYFIVWALCKIVCTIIDRLRKNRPKTILHEVIGAFIKPLKLLFTVAIAIIIMRQLGFTMLAKQAFIQTAQVFVWIAFAWFLWRMVDTVAEVFKRRLMARGQFSVLSAVVFLRRGMKFALLLIVGITILDSFGFNVTTWIAALGIGGIALALGAQKTVENFVGSLTLIADRPIAIGDFCQFEGTKGTVEDIGMRSTRVRTVARTLVTIPNGQFSSMQIENFTRRDHFDFNAVLGLRYETSPDQIRYILIELRKLLYAHPKVMRDTFRAHFVAFNSSSLDIEVVAQINAKNIHEAGLIKDDLNLRMMEIIAEAGSDFAFPSQMTYDAKDYIMDPGKVAEASAKVTHWKNKGKFQSYDLSEEEIAELSGSVEFPSKPKNSK